MPVSQYFKKRGRLFYYESRLRKNVCSLTERTSARSGVEGEACVE